jgi:hypothetical protein
MQGEGKGGKNMDRKAMYKLRYGNAVTAENLCRN